MYRKTSIALALLFLLGAVFSGAQPTQAYSYTPSVVCTGVSEVTAESVQLNGAVNCGSVMRFTNVGFYMNTDAAKIKTNRYTKGMEKKTSSFNIKFTAEDVQDFYGRLRPGTMYYYKLFAIAEGKEYTSDLGYFRTADDTQTGSRVTFSVYDALEVSMDNAILRARVVKNPYGFTFTKVGVLLGQSANSLQEAASAKPNSAGNPDIQFAIGQYKQLNPQTTYYYQFYAMTKSGASYASPVKSFTTTVPGCLVYLDPNGGSLLSAGPLQFIPGQYYALDVLPTREGQVFGGWYTDPVGGLPVDPVGMWPYSGAITLYAHWGAGATSGDARTLQIYFDFNYDGLGVGETKTVKKGNKYGTLPTPERGGYKFGGWYTEKDGGARVKSSTKVKLTGTQALYAHWTPRSYKVTFDPNGGSVKPREAALQYGTVYALPTPAREGYSFAGWYTQREGGAPIAQQWTVDVRAKTTLYARWTPLAYYSDLPAGVTPAG